MIKHVIRLVGPGAQGTRISAPLLKDLLDVLVEGTRRALRLRLEGRSTARGTPPGWLDEAATFDLVGIAPGSTCLVLEAHSVGERLPERFRQMDMFVPFDAALSPLQILGESLSDAVEAKDSDRYDESLVETFIGFSRIFEEGVRDVEFTDGLKLTIGRDAISAVKGLQKRIPPSRWVQVVGTLETIRHSDRMFTLVLESGETLRGVADQVQAGDLAGLWGNVVAVSGTAHFRISGKVLRIEAQQIHPAGDDAALFSKMPRPLLGGEKAQELQRAQGPRSGLAAIIGQWPGDEGEDEVVKALEDLS